MTEAHPTLHESIQSALVQLTGLADRVDLPALVERAPIILSDDFFAAAQAAAADPAAAILRERLQWLAELRQQAEQDVPAALQAVVAATTLDELRQVADQWPLDTDRRIC
jgi:hypothetical protein